MWANLKDLLPYVSWFYLSISTWSTENLKRGMWGCGCQQLIFVKHDSMQIQERRVDSFFWHHVEEPMVLSLRPIPPPMHSNS